jgi:hypothetical protein
MSVVMQKLVAVTVLFFSQLLSAQAPTTPSQPLPSDSVLMRRLQEQAFENWARDSGNEKKKAENAQESAAAHEFYIKAKQFVDLWTAFATELNDKKTFNAKLAKKVAKAFHDLEKSDGWPAGRAK